MNAFKKENAELPAALEDLITFYGSAEGAERLERWRALSAPATRFVFSGMGTSEFAPYAVRWKLFNKELGCEIVDTGEWQYCGTMAERKTDLVVLISQSGESVELKKLLESAKPERFVAITNDDTSTLARHATLTLPLCAGHEAAITTKTYTNTLALLHLLTEARESNSAMEDARTVLRMCAGLMEHVDESAVQRAADYLMPADYVAFVARGPAFVSARQSALTFMEGLKKTTAAFTGGAFRHGPFESMGPDFRMVVFRAPGTTAVILDKLTDDATRLGGHVIVFDGHPRQLRSSSLTVKVPFLDHRAAESLFPLLAARSHNQLLCELADRLGIDIGSFRYGSKITTVE